MAAMDPASLTIRELRERLLAAPGPLEPQLAERLRLDPRQGARRLAEVLARRERLLRAEQTRLERLRARERFLWRSGCGSVAGVDEAGVGPLAGPVVAAAVFFAPGSAALPLDDSKRLPAAARSRLAAAIRATAAGIGIGLADVGEIERLNIYHAALLAMRRAVEALPHPPDHVLVDARVIPGLSVPQEAIVGGDGRHYAIAAASILAKTHRDALMVELHHRHPRYGFDRHKGYGTAAHLAALRAHGPCPAHRRAFGPVAAAGRSVAGEGRQAP